MIPTILGCKIYHTETKDACGVPIKIGDPILFLNKSSYSFYINYGFYIGSSNSLYTDYAINTSYLEIPSLHTLKHSNAKVIKYDWHKLPSLEQDLIEYYTKIQANNDLTLFADFIDYSRSLKTSKKYDFEDYLQLKGITK